MRILLTINPLNSHVLNNSCSRTMFEAIIENPPHCTLLNKSQKKREIQLFFLYNIVSELAKK